MTKYVSYLFGVVAFIFSCSVFSSSTQITPILSFLMDESADRLAFIGYSPHHRPSANESVMLYDEDGAYLWDLAHGLDYQDHLSDLKYIDGKLFFTAHFIPGYTQLYRTHLGAQDNEYTLLVRGLVIGDYNYQYDYSENRNEFTSAIDKLFFVADIERNPGEVKQLWVTDGSTDGVIGLTTQPSFSLVEYNNALYFFIDDTDYSQTNTPSKTSLWKSDGTWDNTVKITDLDEIDVSLSPGEDYPYVAGELLYFPCRSEDNGRELCRTDGSADGTVFIKDIYPNPLDGGSHIVNSSNPEEFYSVNDKLVFMAENENSNKALWVSDGSAGGTQLLQQFSSSYSDSPRYDFIGNTPDGRLLFTAPSMLLNQEALWITDGTSAGTSVLDENMHIDDNTIFRAWMDTTPSAKLGDYLYFSAHSRSGGIFCNQNGCQMGRDLFRTDGNTIELVKDMEIGIRNRSMAVANSKVYFVGHEESSSISLWQSDGTQQGTREVNATSIAPGFSASGMITIPQ